MLFTRGPSLRFFGGAETTPGGTLELSANVAALYRDRATGAHPPHRLPRSGAAISFPVHGASEANAAGRGSIGRDRQALPSSSRGWTRPPPDR